MSLREFHSGEHLSASKLNRMVRAINSLLNLTGDSPMLVNRGPGGVSVGLSIAQLRDRLPKIGGAGIVPGRITAVTEDNAPPCDHQYQAEALDGRVIDEDTSPERPQDADVKYIAASAGTEGEFDGDWCMMWWDDEGTGHLFAITEVYDTIEDS